MHCRGLAHIVFHNLCAKIAGLTAELGWQCIRRPLLKKTAVDICPLNSNTLTSIKALAHNLFHKICEEAQVDEEVSVGMPGRRSGAGSSAGDPAGVVRSGWDYTSPGRHRVCPNFVLANDFPLNSWACTAIGGFAHIVFHSLCAKPGTASNGLCRLKNRRQHFFLTYQ
jgi:hypothetical protein